MIESNMAEVLWHTDFEDRNGNGLLEFDEPVNLYRRLLLIRPDLGTNLNRLAGTPATPVSIMLQNDVSISFAGPAPIANSAEDLARRENRYAHNVVGIPGSFPYPISRTFLRATRLNSANLGALNPLLLQFAGTDVIASDIAAFDLLVFSPNSALRQFNVGDLSNPVTPPDSTLGFGSSPVSPLMPVGNVVGAGAYVDLAYLAKQFPGDYLYATTLNNILNSPDFSTWPNPKSGLQYLFNAAAPALGFDVAFDTYSTHYESNGLDEDADGVADEGRDGLDTDNLNGVDDAGEAETAAPYPTDLRGVKVVFRVVDRESVQAHQTTVVQSFVKK